MLLCYNVISDFVGGIYQNIDNIFIKVGGSMKKALAWLVTTLAIFGIILILFGIWDDIYAFVFRAILSIIIGLLVVKVVDDNTEFINPMKNYTMKLISKEIIMHSGVSKSSTGIFVKYVFVFENEKGECKTLVGKEELYFFIMEDNIVSIDVKKNKVIKFELLSVDGNFKGTI